MTLFYADTSALVRAYFPDEVEHEILRRLLVEDREMVVTSEIARLELASAVRAAHSSGRVRRREELISRVESAFAEDGPIEPIDLRADVIFPTAYRIVLQHGLRTLDAIHVAVCVEECPALAGGDDIVFVTRDAEQAKAARALGLEVR